MFLKQNFGKNRPFFVYFISFLNTMTNIVQNLTIGGKGVDGVLWIRTRDRVIGRHRQIH